MYSRNFPTAKSRAHGEAANVPPDYSGVVYNTAGVAFDTAGVAYSAAEAVPEQPQPEQPDVGDGDTYPRYPLKVRGHAGGRATAGVRADSSRGSAAEPVLSSRTGDVTASRYNDFEETEPCAHSLHCVRGGKPSAIAAACPARKQNGMLLGNLRIKKLNLEDILLLSLIFLLLEAGAAEDVILAMAFLFIIGII